MPDDIAVEDHGQRLFRAMSALMQIAIERNKIGSVRRGVSERIAPLLMTAVGERGGIEKPSGFESVSVIPFVWF
nr:hypothetical protein [Gluconobacter vitians]